jgi:3-methyladenine DNA glycosylase AlkC
MPFADELLGIDAATALSGAISNAAGHPSPHLAAAASSLSPLSLGERAAALSEALLADVPGGTDELARVIRSALATDPGFTGWMIWPVTLAASARAVDEGTAAAFDTGMALQAELTGRLTAEFGIRALLRADPSRALAEMLRWTTSPDPAVRRLASEGSRPFLPWGVRIPQLLGTPDATLPILDALHRDDDEVVRRSVANHLNDLSRDHAALVVATAQRWLDARAEDDATTLPLVRHALRTLVKRGDPGALAVLGFSAGAFEVEGPWLDRDTVPFGGAVEFTAVVRNAGDAAAKVAIDYVVHHRKANGSSTTKTFKHAVLELAPGESVAVRRTHSFRPITTRRYHPGEHAIAVQVNGVATEPVAFELEAEERSAPAAPRA